ncbi:MAG: AsmA family protein [Luminiphilus sp.]|nr:AsmA family protein [Luminiphilus sp.]
MLVILWILGGLLALALIAMLLLPTFIDEQALIDLAQEQVRTNTGGELVVEGEADLSFFPRFGLRVEGTALDLPAQSEFDQSISASIAELDVGLALLPLLSGKVDVGTVMISGVKAEITEPQALPPAPEPQPVMSDREWVKRGELIRQIKAQERQRLLSQEGGGTTVAIVAEALQVKDINLVMRTRDGRLANEIAVENLTLSQVNTRNEPMSLEGQLTVLGDGSAAPLTVSLDGSIQLAADFSAIQLNNLQTRIEGALTKPISSSLKGRLVMSPAKADFAVTAILPGGEVTGALTWAALESPEVRLDIATARLNTDQLQLTPAPSTKGKGAAVPPATQPAAGAEKGGNAVAVPLPVGPLRDLDLEMRINADELIAAGQTITNAQVFLRVRDGVADIEYLRGVMHQGQLDTQLALNARRPIVEAEVKGGLKGVNMNSLLASLGSEDAASGLIEMGWDFETEGATSEDLVAGMDGDLSAEGQNLVFEKVSVQALICNAVAVVNKIPPIAGLPANTPITDLSLSVEFDDGAGDIEKLRFATPGVLMKGEGDIDLGTLDFGFRLEGQVNNEIMEVSPLCVIDQRYAGVDWPVDCKGNLASESPASCRVDVATIAQQIIENEAKQQVQDMIEEKAGSFIKKLFGD